MSDERFSASDAPRAEPGERSTETHPTPSRSDSTAPPSDDSLDLPREYGGRKGPEPVRYGDWEKNGRCIDF